MVTKTEKQYKEGHFIIAGITSGIPIGLPIGLWMGNIALGPLLGAVLGLVIGAVLEKRLNKHPIPLSDFEKARQKKWIWVALGAGVLVFALLTILYFIQG